ncbi:MAG: hypothetical protein JO149_03065, partial [Gammaproteobacteria bacterium]|nr:hypothetical protein [Gammaproteobacteria bacterium]
IEFNIQTGHVNPVSAEESRDVTSFFSPTAFQAYLVPIEAAISLLCQQELLNQLSALGDDHLQQVIRERHTFDGDGKMISNTDQNAVEKTLTYLLRLLKPVNDSIFFRTEKKNLTLTQQCVFEILREIDFYAIKSKNEVITIIDKIKQKMANPLSESQSLLR